MRYILLILTAAAIAFCSGSCQRWETPPTPESVSVLTEPQPGGEPATGGSRPVTISATGDWYAVSDAGWLYVTPSSGHKGIQEVVIHIDENKSGKARTGTVVFSCGDHSESFTVTQTK